MGTTIENIGAPGADYSKSDPPPPQGDYSPKAAKAGGDASDDGKSCGTGAGTGDKGVQGYTGTAGQKGGKGGDANQIKVTADVMEGDYTYTTAGGAGGSGQTGGKGGRGQDGGAGGKGSKNCGGGAQGDGGQGGTGGDGGDAGAGGNAGDIYVTYKSGAPTFQVSVTAGGAGRVGNPGAGGDGGSPNAGSGVNGASGKAAEGGKAGLIFINGKQIQP